MTQASTRNTPQIAATERGYRATLRRLAGAQKPPAVGSPAYSRFVNRRIGRYLAAAAYELGLTPNQVTAISAAFSLVGVVLVATVESIWWLGPVVAFALLLGYAFDSADGQLARLRGGGSPAGEWLDHVVDCAKISALHGAVLIFLFRFADLDHAGWLLLPLAYGLVDAVAFFAMILNDQLKRVHGGRTKPAAVTPSNLRSLLVLPTDYGVFCLMFVLLGAPTAFLIGYGVLLVCNAAYLAAALPKWYRAMRALQ
jgi:phosphatidylglycerophosphate synthase